MILALSALVLFAPPPQLSFEDMDEQYGDDSRCVAWSQKHGSMLCVLSRAGWTGEHHAVWVKVPAATRKSLHLIVGAEPEDRYDASGSVDRFPAHLAQVNRRLKRGRYAPATTASVRLTHDKRAVSVWDGSRLVERIPWLPSDEMNRVVPVAYQAGPKHLVVVLSFKHEGTVHREASLHVVALQGGRRAACPATASCPERYGRLEPYLALLCTGELGKAHIDILRGERDRGAITQGDLAVLFNAVGAMDGYTFKRLASLNAFFYGGPDGAPWLPSACRMSMKKGKRSKPQKSVRASGDRVRALWKAGRKKAGPKK